MKSRSKLFLEKSISAMLSAIEIYNKPDFKYREESFSVLCINSWELLLKSKVLNLSSNKMDLLYKKEYKTLKNGKKSAKLSIRKNRSKNPLSIGLFEAYSIITEDYGLKINNAIKDNLIALTEIRDNAIHFINDDIIISLKVQELGSASLQNYLNIVSSWYGNVLDQYNFFLMPLSFFRDFSDAVGIPINSNEKRVLKFIKNKEAVYDSIEEIGNYNLTLRIDVKFQKVKSNSSVPVVVSEDSKATPIRIMEEDIIETYPWDYRVLYTFLSKRYSDFKANKEYHNLRKEFEKNKKYAYARLLDPNKPQGSKKKFYNPNIIKEFDKHYVLIKEKR